MLRTGNETKRNETSESLCLTDQAGRQVAASRRTRQAVEADVSRIRAGLTGSVRDVYPTVGVSRSRARQWCSGAPAASACTYAPMHASVGSAPEEKKLPNKLPTQTWMAMAFVLVNYIRSSNADGASLV